MTVSGAAFSSDANATSNSSGFWIRTGSISMPMVLPAAWILSSIAFEIGGVEQRRPALYLRQQIAAKLDALAGEVRRHAAHAGDRGEAALLGHSGSPALHRPSANRARSSGRRNGTKKPNVQDTRPIHSSPCPTPAHRRILVGRLANCYRGRLAGWFLSRFGFLTLRDHYRAQIIAIRAA